MDKTTWTDLRIHIQKTSEQLKLDIKPIGFHTWPAVEYRVVHKFTGDDRVRLTWMWEERILDSFDHADKHIPQFTEMCDIFRAIICADEPLWLFIEDNLRLKTKFWGYSDTIGSILALLGELPGLDFYIASKKLEWVAGQNHSDVIFAYGDLAEKLRGYLAHGKSGEID